MSLGLKRGMVKLEPHDNNWELEAEKIIAVLKSILGKAVVDIQHVGSTAISAISAKPIIDIAVGLKDIMQIHTYNDRLEKQGIYCRGSYFDGQILYVCGDLANDIRTHHIHIVKWNGTEWNNYLNFRDYLNANADIALQYQHLKEELEGKYMNDRSAYMQGKHALINEILENAGMWRAIYNGKSV